MRTIRSLLGGFLLCGLCAAGARAQTADDAALKPIAIPASPAFTFLGVSPGTIDRPTTARALSVSLLGEVVSSGNVPQGLAIDVAPWSFVPGLRITGDRYRTSRFYYALANTQVSIGSASAAGDSADTDLSTGVRVTLFDRGDPLTNLEFRADVASRTEACFRPVTVPPPAAPGTTPPPVKSNTAEMEECVNKVTESARRAWYKDHWNDPSLSVAAAMGHRFVGSRVDDTESLGWAAWATGSMPLGGSGQILAQLRYADRDGPSGLGYGGRAYFGTAGANAFVEVSRDGSAESPETDWAGGVEFRVRADSGSRPDWAPAPRPTVASVPSQ